MVEYGFYHIDILKAYIPLNISTLKNYIYCLNCEKDQPAFMPNQIRHYFSLARIPVSEYQRACSNCGFFYRVRKPGYKIPTIIRKEVYRVDNSECVYCASKEDLTLDHITPYTRGGEDSLENLVTCCKKCNSSKGNRPSHLPFNFGRFKKIKFEGEDA